MELDEEFNRFMDGCWQALTTAAPDLRQALHHQVDQFCDHLSPRGIDQVQAADVWAYPGRGY